MIMKPLQGSEAYRCPGLEFGIRAVQGITASKADCIAQARNATEGLSREELVKFIGEMVYGIVCLKQEIVNERLFGAKPGS